MKKNVWTFLLSLAIAFGLWVYVVTAVNPEFEDNFYNIPVVLEGEGLLEERGLMITANENPTISLRLKGNRSYLVEMKNSDITILADVSKISKAGTYHVSYEEIFPAIFRIMPLLSKPGRPIPLRLRLRSGLPSLWMWW